MKISSDFLLDDDPTCRLPHNMVVKRSGRYRRRQATAMEVASDICRMAFTGRPPIYTDGRTLRMTGHVVRVPDATSHDDLLERVWSSIALSGDRTRSVRAELHLQLGAYWENRSLYEMRPVPRRSSDWGVFFSRSTTGQLQGGGSFPTLMPAGLRVGRFASPEGHSVAAIRVAHDDDDDHDDDEVPPSRTRHVHGWGTLLNHACPDHASFQPYGGWKEAASFTRVRECSAGEEATVTYSLEEDLPCPRCAVLRRSKRQRGPASSNK